MSGWEGSMNEVLKFSIKIFQIKLLGKELLSNYNLGFLQVREILKWNLKDKINFPNV